MDVLASGILRDLSKVLREKQEGRSKGSELLDKK